MLLLYTDGLVETRTRSLDDGIDLLSAALADCHDDQTPAQTCEALLQALVAGDPEDDVAILAIHIDH
jgi:serine phosphatase RsbU (regulator of sigma subunit)